MMVRKIYSFSLYLCHMAPDGAAVALACLTRARHPVQFDARYVACVTLKPLMSSAKQRLVNNLPPIVTVPA